LFVVVIGLPQNVIGCIEYGHPPQRAQDDVVAARASLDIQRAIANNAVAPVRAIPGGVAPSRDRSLPECRMILHSAVLSFPNIDPVAFEVGPVAVKWYGLAYLAGLLLGWLYIRRLLQTPAIWAGGAPPLQLDRVDDLLLYVTAGVILGGRLGFVLFYEPTYYLENPADIAAVWKGGMSFHGALVGSGLAIWAFAARNGFNPLSAMDLCAAAVPIGLLFGRLANFINGELFGRVSDVPWAMVFPEARLMFPAVEPAPRHPSQLYEAALEGILLLIVLRIMTHSFGALKKPGLVIGAFLVGYGLARSFAEAFREPHAGHPLNIDPFTAGQMYSLPMIVLGIVFIVIARRRTPAAT
jgi:phosphatidylglycerol:prolipoprotein diacylglycerol transferase